jgi:hypothetical protein
VILTEDHLSRRTLLTAGAALATVGLSRIVGPGAGTGRGADLVHARRIEQLPSWRANRRSHWKWRVLDDGTVRRAGDGAPLAGQRIQIWAHTTEGHERDPQSHGATLTDANGEFRLEMPQIVPAFGQPHGHLAYDSGEFETVFLRPVMPSASDTRLQAHFVLQPA